jgi:uncharacterized membrane protein YwaF
VAFPLMLMLSGEIRPRAKNLWRPALFLLIVTPPIYFINKALGTNFFFINSGSAGSPLELLIDVFGTRGFLFAFAGLLAVVWLLMYLPYIMLDARKKRA